MSSNSRTRWFSKAALILTLAAWVLPAQVWAEDGRDLRAALEKAKEERDDRIKSSREEARMLQEALRPGPGQLAVDVPRPRFPRLSLCLDGRVELRLVLPVLPTTRAITHTLAVSFPVIVSSCGPDDSLPVLSSR